MFFSPSLAVAGFAALSSAFLLPPSTSEDSDVITTLPFPIATNTDGQVINLECAGCPVPVGNTRDGLAVMMTGLKSELQLDFAINHLKSSDVLTLNGVQLYPISSVMEQLKAPQIVTTSSEGPEIPSDHVNVDLGYESRINIVNNPAESDKLELYSIRVQIIEVGGKFVDGLAAVEMKLIATPAGGLMIAELIKTPTTNPALAPGAECKTMICKFKQILGNKIGQIKPKKGGCGRGRGRKGVPAGFGQAHKSGRPHGKDENSHHGQHPHHHRHHSRLHRFFHAMKSIALQVLIPVFVGIACGFAASFIGMIVGHAIVFLWRAFFRRGQRGTYIRIVQEDVKVDNAPPAYTDEHENVLDEKTVQL